MKRRLLLIALAMLTLVPTVSCSRGGQGAVSGSDESSNETSGTAVTTDGGSETTPGGDEATKMISWISNGYDKIIANGDVPKKPSDSHTVYMAKGESEGCQISLRSPEDMAGVTVEISAPEGLTASASIEKTQRIAGKRWPDGLLPLDKVKSFDLKSGETSTVYIKFISSGSTPAGDHKCTVTVKDGSGEAIATAGITVHVWDFELDGEDSIECWIPVIWEALAKEYGFGDLRAGALPEEDMERLRVIYKLYYDMLLDYGICGGDLPYDILDDRADEYLNDPRVRVFTIGSGEVDEETLRARYNKIKDNPEWLAKAVYYSLDEPTTRDMLDELASRSAAVRRIAPGVKTISAYYENITYDGVTDATGFLQEHLDISVPKLCLFERVGGLESYKKRFQAYRAAGNKVYTYVCWEPWKPFLNVFVNEEGIDHRALFWQIYDCGADGFLYWAANQWYDLDVNPWNSMQTIPWMTRDIYGDGSFMYPGNKFGFDDPCSSLRLEAVRDGLEDNTLLRMAKKHLSSSWLDKEIDKVTKSPAISTTDSGVFDTVRINIGNALEKALSGK